MKRLLLALSLLLPMPLFGAASWQGTVIASNDTGRLVVPTNFFQANVIAGSNMLFEITNRTGLIIHSTAVGGGGGSATNAQPPSEILTNISVTGAITNLTGITNLLQPASAVLTNLVSNTANTVTNFTAGSGISGSISSGVLTVVNTTPGGAATNAQPPSEILTNISVTGAVTNLTGITNLLQPASSILTNISGTGAITNLTGVTNLLQPASANLTNWSGAATSAWATVGYVQSVTNTAMVINGAVTPSGLITGNGGGLTNVQASGITGTTLQVSNATFYSSAVGNIPLKAVQFNDDTNVIQQWEIRPRPSGTVNVMATMATNGALTLAGPMTATAGNFSSAVLSTAASASNAPAANELTTAQWVRSLFNNGVLYYATTNINANATNTDTANQPIYTFATTIPTSFARSYVNPGAGTYIGSVITTNTFQVLQGPIDVRAFLSFTGGSGGPAATIHPEIYYSYDRTNWYGDWSGPQQTVVYNATNLYQWVVSFPSLTATNSAGFYIERRYKVDTISGSGSPTLNFFGGTNVISGPSDAGHIALSGPNSSYGNAYLAANQTFTGSNTFTLPPVGNGSSLTNVNGANVTNIYSKFGRVSVKEFGALGTGLAHTNVTIAAGATNLFGTNSAFTSSDIGKLILIEGAGPGGTTNDLLATITNVASTTSIFIYPATARAASGVNCVYGYDDSTNIQNCLNYCATNALTMYFPPGIYVVNGYRQSPTTKNSIFTVPNNGESMAAYATPYDVAHPIRIEGETLGTTGGGNAKFGWYGSWIAFVGSTNNSGNLFQFGDDSVGTWSDSSDTGIAGYNNVCVRFKGIGIRMPNNITMTAIDCFHTSGESFEDVNVFAGHNSYATVIVPTTATSYGIRMSDNGLNGNGLATLDRVQVAGFYNGLFAAEHTDMRSITIYSCVNGVVFANGAPHLVSAERLGLQSCINGIKFQASAANVILSGVEIEHGTGSWAVTADIQDGANFGQGVLHYTVYNPPLVVTGGGKLKMIGSAQYSTGNYLAPTNGAATGYILTLNSGTNSWAENTGGNATNAQPPSTILTNIAVTGAITNLTGITNLLQPASANLTNWSGTATSSWATVGYAVSMTNQCQPTNLALTALSINNGSSLTNIGASGVNFIATATNNLNTNAIIMWLPVTIAGTNYLIPLCKP